MKTLNHPGQPIQRAINCLIYGAVYATVLLGFPAQAQTIYRIVGNDGRVTFSDKAPTAADQATVVVGGGRTMTLDTALLPSELRQAAGKFPVTLYTSAGCAPCNSGRELLGSRGIPFSERTVNTAEDAEALQRISGGSSLPFLTIGGQQIKGFSESEWTQFLDAAGYPKTSVLPAAYRAPPATPLVMLQRAAPPAKPEEAQPQPTPSESSPTPANPAGIRF